ncbi:MAG TPA: hypothetical protein VM735_02025 [Candidatus Kapabacteria bacterium]|nr:hypothetical protein [Candidatus Kapabacteria bacterium]
MSDLNLIVSTLAKTAQRRRLERGFRRFWQGLFWGAVAWLVFLAAYKLAPIPDEWVYYSWLVIPASALIAFFWGFSRSVTVNETARWVDSQVRLQERISTALEVSKDDRAAEWKNLIVSDAAKTVSSIKPKELLPLRLPGASKWALVVLILGVGLGFVPEYRSKATLAAKQDAEAIKQTGRELAQLTKRNMQARPPVLETTKKSLEEMQDLGNHLAKAQLSRGEALKELSSLTEKLKEQTRDLAKDPAIRNLERASRNGSKSSSPSAEIQQKMDNLAKQLGAQAANSEAMEKLKQDLQKAKDMASNLPKGDSPEAKQAKDQMQASLADLAKQAKDLGLDLPSLSEAIAALQQAAPDQVLKDLQVAEVELEKMEQMAKALEKMQLDMQKLGKDLAEQLKNGQAEAAESTLRKMAGSLSNNKLTPEQMEKVMKEVGEALDAAKQYGEVGAQMKKAMQNMQAGKKGEAGQNLKAAADELGKMMGELGDAQSMLASLEALQQAAMCIANGQGYCENPNGKGAGNGRKTGKSQSGVGTWTDENSWDYPEMVDSWDNSGIERADMDGKGVSDRGDGQLADALAPTKIKGQITPGGPMPSITMKGVSIKGTSKVQVEAMSAAAQSDAQAALNQDQVPRAYQNAVRNYFDDLKD